MEKRSNSEGALVRVTTLRDGGDTRGSSFSLPDELYGVLPSILDLHIMTLRRKQVRGNHYHVDRREFLVVLFSDEWSLHWDTGPNTAIQRKNFFGHGAVLIEIQPSASHAIFNDGKADIYILSMLDGKFDPDQPDAYKRAVIEE